MDHVNYQYHKFAGYILSPIRLLFFNISTLLAITSLIITDKINKKLGVFLYLKYVELSIKLFGLDIHVQGLENLTENPCIIISNHINIYDNYVMVNTLNRLPPYIVSKRFDVKPINIIFNFMKCIYTENKKGYVVEKMKQRIKEGGQVFIYPDGCNLIPDKKLIAPFKSGAFVPKAPIQPIVIRYVSSSNTNMNWYYEDSSKDNNPFSLLKSYLLDGDIKVYVKILPLQYYKESYKSHEDYRDEIYGLMTKELSLLPEQKPNLQIQEPSSEYIIKYLIYLLYLSGFSYVIGNYQFTCYLFMNFIAGYFCHFYPTKNTCLLDSLSVSYTFTRGAFTSIQNQYDLYFRSIYMIFIMTRGYRWLQYRDIKPFDEKKHVWNAWIPTYTFTLYPLLLNTLELYNIL
tara:strand:- start:151 stop:1353 length:1203 start_codon:yes stop_codon:yes gene_type:complete